MRSCGVYTFVVGRSGFHISLSGVGDIRCTQAHKLAKCSLVGAARTHSTWTGLEAARHSTWTGLGAARTLLDPLNMNRAKSNKDTVDPLNMGATRTLLDPLNMDRARSNKDTARHTQHG